LILFIQIHTKKRNRIEQKRLDMLVFVNYNKRLYDRFHRRRLENKDEDFDPIRVEELNYNSEWMTGVPGAANEFVYSDDGLTWAQVDTALGASDYISSGPRDTRQKRRRVAEKRKDGKGKGKQPLVEEEEEWEDREESEDNEDATFESTFCDSSGESR
jgi:hypothetical protein